MYNRIMLRITFAYAFPPFSSWKREAVKTLRKKVKKSKDYISYNHLSDVYNI